MIRAAPLAGAFADMAFVVDWLIDPAELGAIERVCAAWRGRARHPDAWAGAAVRVPSRTPARLLPLLARARCVALAADAAEALARRSGPWCWTSTPSGGSRATGARLPRAKSLPRGKPAAAAARIRRPWPLRTRAGGSAAAGVSMARPLRRCTRVLFLAGQGRFGGRAQWGRHVGGVSGGKPARRRGAGSDAAVRLSDVFYEKHIRSVLLPPF